VAGLAQETEDGEVEALDGVEMTAWAARGITMQRARGSDRSAFEARGRQA